MLSCSLPFMPLHQPVWAGDAQQLVVSIDIGMAHTTVAYCILEPKVEPELEQVQFLVTTLRLVMFNHRFLVLDFPMADASE
jgi:hypothetical protein